VARLTAALAAALVLLAPAAAAQAPGAYYYTAMFVVAPKGAYNLEDPWSVRGSGAPVAWAVLRVDGGVSVYNLVLGRADHVQDLVEVYGRLAELAASAVEESGYYHVAIAPDLTAARCGPAQALRFDGGVAYYYKGVLLYAAVEVAEDEQGLAVIAYYYLDYDGVGVCGDPLVDGVDFALIAGFVAAASLGAYKGYKYARSAARRIFEGEGGSQSF